MTGFYPPHWQHHRVEAKGEAQQRLANWLCNFLRGWPLFMTVHNFEQQGLAQFLGAVNRKWPAIGKWGAPNNDAKP